jgi:uncharacterized protein YdeI (YjbR/CyaY-like superfamily)
MQDKFFQAECAALKAILDKTPMQIAVKWGAEVYTHNGKNVVSYGGFKNHFCLWFYNGVFLKDPYQVLVNANGEKTKALRQWRFASADKIDEEKILEYVLEAIENEEKGLSWKPEKSAPAEIPPILEEAFAQNTGLDEAFLSLTPFKQKEYIEHFISAKKVETQIARIEKAIPMILEGKGLHDKYRK